MENNPKISVITVCFNAIDSIENTIRSVLSQTYSNIEYIIVDGGSSDGTVDIIKKYDGKIANWISEKDHGIYDAMNKGILMSTGEWINFRNCGDTFSTKDALSKIFEVPVDNSVSVLHGDCFFVSKFDYIRLVPPVVKNVNCFQFEMPVFHIASFIRRSLHQSMLYDLSYRASADYDFFYKCCKQGLLFEYRPVAVSVFAMDGYTSIHKGVTIRENRRLQGKYTTMIDKILTEIMIKKIEFVDYIKNVVSKHSKLVRKHQLLNRKKEGRMPLDGTEPFILNY